MILTLLCRLGALGKGRGLIGGSQFTITSDVWLSLRRTQVAPSGEQPYARALHRVASLRPEFRGLCLRSAWVSLVL